VRDFLTIAKALGDQNRVRVLLALRQGELCLCQIIELLKLAPSTVSKHVDLLRQAGLIDMRKQGQWHYYRLADKKSPPVVREALRWVLRSLETEQVVVADAATLCCVRDKDPQELAACYSRS
jgi:ArsR family transcriptional regulator, arsenate/arsenite/antimonite-responsive transcriptional repressor